MIKWVGVCVLLASLPALLAGQKKTEDIYALDHLVEIRVNFLETDWHARLDSLKEGNYETRLTANVTVDGVAYAGAGVRYKGNSSFFNVRNEGYRKLPFNIKVNHSNRKLRLPGGFTTLKLSNVFRDPSFLREVLAYEIAGQYMPAPRANYAKVYVGDEYLGLYNLSESVDDDLLSKFFGDDHGILVKCDPYWHQDRLPGCPAADKSSLQYLGKDSICYRPYYELKQDEGWAQLIDLTRILNNEPQRLEQVMNVNEALWMLAFDNVVVNLDSYIGQLCHNYYLYKDTFGIWHPIVWDMNLSFGGFRRTGIGPPLTNEKMQEMSMFLHYSEQNNLRPLVLKLLENEHHRKRYLAHVRTIVEENFANGRYLERARAIQDFIRAEVSKDNNRLYDLEAFQQNLSQTVVIDNTSVIGIEELMAPRTAYLVNHPLLLKEPPTVEKPTHLPLGETIAISTKLANAQKAWVYYRTVPNGPWRAQEMRDDSGHHDQLADDGIWGAVLPATNLLEYYVVAENQYIATFSPRRAGKEYYTATAE